MSNSYEGAEYIARTLKGFDVDHVFYIEAILKIAIRELKHLGIKPVMAHTENAAAYMADGYARMSGKPSVCFAQSIGAANLAGGIHEAWLAGSPVISFTGKKPPVLQHRGSYQEADHRLLYEGITKFNADISDSEQMPVVLRQLFREAVTGKPRPVHTDISNNVGRLMELATVESPVITEQAYTIYPPYRPKAEEERVAAAADKINKADNPIIIIGRGAAISGAGKNIYKLAQKGDIPVATSPDGKAQIDESDDLWCGIVGEYGMDCANKIVGKADLVIFIGTQAGDQTTFNWQFPLMETSVIQIDIDPAELGKNYPNCVGLPGDARVVTAQLTEAIAEKKRDPWRAECREVTGKTLKEYTKNQNSDVVPMRPERLCEEISKALPDDAVVVADTGYSAVWSATMIRMKASQKYLRAAGSLGWSYPASLGVKCATDRPVVCFTGDGAFYYHLNEMETAMRNGINTVTIINDNSAFVQTRLALNEIYKDEPESVEEMYCFADIDFCRIADAYGCWSKRVEKPEEFANVFKEALNCGRPAIIDVRTERAAEVPSAV